MSDNDNDYVKDMRARFEANANQSHALVIEVLAVNKLFIEILNHLGIDPTDGSPTAEDTVAMRIQKLQKIEEAANFLLEVKMHKDANGKDEWYREVQPKAWGNLIKALSDLS